MSLPVYQIDFTAAAAGKRVAATKRRIRWRFGFPNKQALAQGLSGTDCRGEEHEIVVVWSVTSGKRQIMYDGKEIHYSATRTSVIDHSWSGKGNHVMKVVCHAAPPMSANPGFRQYDMFIDGQSFFSMPKVYELGIKGGAAATSSSVVRGNSLPPAIHAPQTPDEEEAELQRAITASLQETKQHLNRSTAPATAPEVDLLGENGGNDFFAAPPPAAPALPHSDASVMSYTSAPTLYASAPAPYAAGAPPQQPPAYPGAPPPPQPYNQPYTSAPVPGLLALPSTQPGSYPPPSPAASAYTAPTYFAPAPAPVYASNDFAPVLNGGADDPFAPKPPSRNDLASEILKGYNNGMPPASPAGMYPPTSPYSNGGPPSEPAAVETPTLSMNGLITAEDDDANLSELEKAMRNLVNVDRIDEPAEQKMKLTMKRQEEEKSKKKSNKSEPLPPAAHRLVGSHATLGQISTVKPKKEIKEGIMSTPPWDPAAAQAGMLVLHGQSNQGGPPPLAPRGFGVVHGQQPYTYGQMAPPPPQQQQYYGGYQQPQYR
ncbi:hypothetical protein FisN_14Lh078 [Fistulifera solaris]|uniref:Uncharacterized protein n=1 Tax=Fistulifera solaris TaxID=1519565 RepID=A0A1Z5J9T9_FISSO|nr:hypothetical protein FisN_14Lh078 [Fistulifera solaris]|eukprot:GAX10578.1 hypothetical protein FisN_14Lh078 [Fistulifera solaris]